MSFNEWKEVKVGEICNVSSSKRIYASEYVDKGIPFLRSKEVIQKATNEEISEVLYIEPKKYFELKNKFGAPQLGDILLASIGANMGISYYVDTDEEFYFKDGNVTWFSNFSKNINSRYIYYCINTPIIKANMLNNAIGSAQKALTIESLKRIEIPLPPIEEQKAIAKILSDLDDKIEVNNKINQKLEKMAQAIFKQWFIDFDFPNEEGNPYKSSGGKMVESELGMIPKGWEVKMIKDFGEVITGKTPSTKKKENYGDKYPFITIPDMHNTMFINTVERYLSEEGHNSQPKKLIPKNSIIVSCIATVGLVGINSIDSHTNQQINSVIPNNERLLPYLYFTIKDKKEYLNLLGSAGTTTKNVNKGLFESIKIVNPKNELIEKFYEMINSSLGKIEKNIVENEKLEKTRDTLLPKLMSGEMRVPINKEN